MEHTRRNPVKIRIDWCRRQIEQARTEPEVDGWCAEEDGLRDALSNSDHTEAYRLCPPEIRQRYMLGLQDGMVLLRAAWLTRTAQTAEPQDSTPNRERDGRSGDE